MGDARPRKEHVVESHLDLATWEAFRIQAVERSHLDRIAPTGSPARLAYLVLGLCGEANEAVDAMGRAGSDRVDVLSELGDVAWYLAMVSTESGVSVTWPIRRPVGRRSFAVASHDLLRHVCAAAECAKRPLCGRPMKPDSLRDALDGVAVDLMRLADLVGTSVSEVLAANIAKNHARFGTEGYTVERQRVLDAAQGVVSP